MNKRFRAKNGNNNNNKSVKNWNFIGTVAEWHGVEDIARLLNIILTLNFGLVLVNDRHHCVVIHIPSSRLPCLMALSVDRAGIFVIFYYINNKFSISNCVRFLGGFFLLSTDTMCSQFPFCHRKWPSDKTKSCEL